MLLWIILGLMTAGIVALVIGPLLRKERESEAAVEADPAAAIYRAQLAAIASERAQGLIGVEEAKSAEGEIGRRLLKLEAKREGATEALSRSGSSSAKAWALGLALTLPASAMALYLALGSPHLPGQDPVLREAQAKEDAEYRTLVENLSKMLASGKGDAKGWLLLAQAHRRLGDPAAAAKALEDGAKMLADKGEPVPTELWLARGEALTAVAQGVVSPLAVEAFEKALAISPKDPVARYYLALAAMQKGDKAAAKAAWQSLANETPKDDPLAPLIAERLKGLASAP